MSKLSPIQRSFLLFLLTGGAATVVNLVLRYVLSRVMLFEAAVACAYVLSTAVAFLPARTFVFGGTLHWGAQLSRFIVVNALGFFQVLAISVFLVRFLFPRMAFHWHPEETAHLIGLASLAFTSFYAHRQFSFRNGTAPHPDAATEKDA
jgi:putative flippase GtrA